MDRHLAIMDHDGGYQWPYLFSFSNLYYMFFRLYREVFMFGIFFDCIAIPRVQTSPVVLKTK